MLVTSAWIKMDGSAPHPLNTPLEENLLLGEQAVRFAPNSFVDTATSEITESFALVADTRNPSLPPPVPGDWFCDEHTSAALHQPRASTECCECKKAKPSDESCLVSNDAQWWWMHKKGWRKYEPKSNRRIEKAFLSGEHKLSVKSGKKGSRPFGVFFNEMTQFDPETKVERAICRSGRFTCWQRTRRFFGQYGQVVEDGRSRIHSLQQYKDQQERLKMTEADELARIARRDTLRSYATKSGVGFGSMVLNKIQRNYWIFEAVSMMAVLLNAAWIAIEADTNDAPTLASSGIGFQIVEYSFCLIFTLELLIRFLMFPVKSNCWKDRWFRFDAFLVVLMVIETWLTPFILWISQVDQSKSSGLDNFTILRLARLVRLTRVSRLVRWAPEIMTLMKGILLSVRSVMFTYLLLAFLLYTFGIIFKTLEDYYDGLRELEHFTTIRRSMWTLMLHGLFLDEISPLLNAMQDASGDFTCFVFLLFVLLGHFTVLNMVIGFQCEVAQRVSQKDKKDAEEYFLRQNLISIMECYDKNDSKFLEKKEFQLLLQDPDVHEVLTRFGTDPDDLHQMADVLFRDKQAEAVLGQSRYNEQYFCNVLRAEEKMDGSIEIDFDAYCDGSLGDLANPFESVLADVKPTDIKFEINDPRSNIKGTLTFSGVDLDNSHGKPQFRYGRRGHQYGCVDMQIKRAVLGQSQHRDKDTYRCTVFHVEEVDHDTAREILLNFEARCDGTIGALPDPALSTLVGKNPKRVIIDDGIENDQLYTKGTLVFEGLDLSRAGSVPFMFGADFTTVDLFVPRSYTGCRLSFLETLSLVQRLRGNKNSQVTDIVELREYLRRLLDKKLDRSRHTRGDRTDSADLVLSSPSSRISHSPSPRRRNGSIRLNGDGEADSADHVPAWADRMFQHLARVSEKVEEIEKKLPSKELLVKMSQHASLVELSSC